MGKFVFNLPDIGEGIAEAEIVAWHVKICDRIEEDQPIADMMTHKATVEMESPAAGIVSKIAGEEGDVIAIGSMLIEIETDNDDVEAETAVVAETPKSDVITSPAESDVTTSWGNSKGTESDVTTSPVEPAKTAEEPVISSTEAA